MIAQLVEQWTENPCVAGSTPARTTEPPVNSGGFLLEQSLLVELYTEIILSILRIFCGYYL